MSSIRGPARLLNRSPAPAPACRHSLGGALALLAAYDIARQLPSHAIELSCYTFGAPRVGNRAWTTLHDAAVHDTWHIINRDDAIPSRGRVRAADRPGAGGLRAPACSDHLPSTVVLPPQVLGLYKRGGQRVQINRRGDMLVRPTYSEGVVRHLAAGVSASIKDHKLDAYSAALAAVLASQFSPKSMQRGQAGALELTRQGGVSIVLRTAGLARDALQVLEREGWDALKELQAARARARQRVRWWCCGAPAAAAASDGASEQTSSVEDASGEEEEGSCASQAVAEVAAAAALPPAELQVSWLAGYCGDQRRRVPVRRPAIPLLHLLLLIC